MKVVTVARKPLEGTVAANSIKWGTGGLNIDRSRIGTSGGTRREGQATRPTPQGWANMGGHGIAELDAGRWPANLILTAQAAADLDEQSGDRRSAGMYPSDSVGTGGGHTYFPVKIQGPLYDDEGGASRYFKIVGGGPISEP